MHTCCLFLIVAAGLTMDAFGYGTPFWIAALLVLLTLQLTGAMAGYATATTTGR